MKSKKLLVATIILFLVGCLTFSAFAHSGRTDGSGGHYNHSTGTYHYHHGYPAHQHTNGVCPYDYEDNADYIDNNDSYDGIPSNVIVIIILIVIIVIAVALSIITKLNIMEIMAHILNIPFYILIAISISISYIIDKIKNRKK